MKTFKKFFMVALSVLASTMLMLCVTACNIVAPPSNSGSVEENEFRKVYAVYVAYAEERGETPLSYEEWLASIKGEKGDQGLSAYEIWLEQGHEGTEEDFLNWLKGENEQACAHEFGAWVSLSADDVAPQDKLHFRTCSLCKEVEWRQGVDAIEHSWVTTVVAPTCLGQGYDLLTCTLCGATQKANFVAVADHNWVTITVDSSCQSQGYTETKCTTCGESHITDVEPSAHSWVISTIEPTCHSQGYTLKKCSKCGVQEKSNYTATIAHTFATTLSYDKSFHWFNCVNCSATKDKVEHTEGEDGNCIACGMIVADTAGVLYDVDASGEFAIVIGYNGTAKAIKIAETYNGVPVTQIYEKAFYNNDTITSVIIPDSVTTIGERAFYNCSNLTSVEIGESVTTIGDYAFYSCSSLTSVVIGDGVTTIGEWAFGYCSNLTSVEIGESVTTIGSSAFAYCSSLTSVVIEGNVTSVGSSIFYYCYNIKNVVAPAIVLTNISKSNLQNVTITFGEISSEMLSSCSKLTSVVIGDGVTTIGGRPFYNCTSLTSITVDEANDIYASIDGNLYSKDGKILIQYAIGKTNTEFFVLNSVTTIGDYAFSSCSSLTSVVIGESVATIGDYAFSSCSSLTSVVIGSSVTSIGNYAFAYCSSLTSVVIPDSVTSIGYYAFNNCSSLRYNEYGNCKYLGSLANPYYALIEATNKNYSTYTIHSDTVVVASYAFYECSRMANITIPDSVTTIGDYAFYYCTSLTSVYITDLKAWCEIEFEGYASNPLCNGAKLYLNGELIEGEVIIPEGTTKIGNYAFYKQAITSVVIPDSVTTIDGQAFSSCSSLTSVVIGNSVTSIGNSAFEYCSSLTSVVIPDSVTTIGDYAFYYCSSLTSVIIGDSVTTIGSSAFSNCGGLTSVVIPDSVTTIGDGAFYDCSSLTSIYITDLKAWCEIEFEGYASNPLYYNDAKLYLNGELIEGEVIIPEGTSKIGNYAFYNQAITSVEIPDSVTTIGDYAFYYCASLTSVVIPDSVTSIGEYAFYNCSSLQYNEYDNCKYLGSLTNPYYALIRVINTNYTSYTIHSDTVVIAGGAFSGCSRMANITIPDSVTSIGYAAFRNCSSFTSIVIGDSVTTIGDYAFCDCSSLTSVEIGDSVTSIGYMAFYYCTSLTSVVIGNSVTSIGNYAFEYCSSLTSIKYRGTSSQWSAINKEGGWDYNTGNYTITYDYQGE